MDTSIDAGAAKLAGLQIDLLQKIRSGNMSLEHFEWWSNLSREQREIISGADLKGLTKYQVVSVSVDYSKSVEEMKAAGEYGYANENITQKNFPHVGSGTGKLVTDIHLIHRDKSENSQKLIDEMDAQGYRPAVLAELLAIGEQHPELQRKFPILALGQTKRLDDDLRVPYLDGWSGERKLDLHWFSRDWNRDCRFAFVRKDLEA